MKTRTKKELEKLAVEALVEGATVDDHRTTNHLWGLSAQDADRPRGEEVLVYAREQWRAKIALAAALRALAEVRRCA